MPAYAEPPARPGGSFLQFYQIFLHIPIADAILQHHILAPIQNTFAGNGTKTVPGRLAFLLVDQVAVLLGDGLGTVLDLVDLAGAGGGIKHNHVEFTDGELQDENLFLWGGQLGFQQNDILHYTPLYPFCRGYNGV